MMAILSYNWKIAVLALFVGILTLFYFYSKRKYTYWERNGFKVLPRVSYLFGHFKGTILEKVFIADVVTKLYNATTEPFIGIYSVFTPVLLVRDPELIRSILIKDFAHFTDR